MNLRDLIYQKQNIDKKIEEITRILLFKPANDLADEIVDLIDERQQVLLKIKSANSQCTLNLGGQKIDLNSAVLIRSNLKLKIDVLSKLIVSESDLTLDRLELIKQRDKFLEDYAVLDMSIINTDINTRIG